MDSASYSELLLNRFVAIGHITNFPNQHPAMLFILFYKGNLIFDVWP